MDSNAEFQENIAPELYAKFFHGLSNPTRFKIVQSLLEKEMNVTELMDELGLKQAQVSNQLACLKWCGYVSTRQEGKFIYYQIKDERVREILNLATQLVNDNAHHISQCIRM